MVYFADNTNLTVGQTWTYFDRMPINVWATKVVHSWFREVRYTIDIYDVDNVTVNTSNNFTQLAWAKVQFLGCAAARLGKGLLATCYYWPKGNIIGEPVFIRGKDGQSICTQCEKKRNSCSLVLTGLCGLGRL